MRSKASSFVHVLSTRIGIGVYDEAWFDYRLTLFSAITVPSMMAQSSQDFVWQLVVDKRMPPRARARFDEIMKPVENARIIEVEFKTDFRKVIVKSAKAYAAEKSAEYVLSSRLDDDDALHVKAFERLQTETERFFAESEHEYAALSLNVGCMWLPSHARGYTRYHDSHSLGLSLLEPADASRSVYGYPHRELKQRVTPRGAYVRGIDGNQLWWLYAAHTIADSDKGDGKRHGHILNHQHGYPVDEKLIEQFGLVPEQVAQLREVTEPTPRRATKFLSLRARDTEKEIKELRTKLRKGPGRLQRVHLRRKLARLERVRVRAGSRIVE